jgi:tRNA pseudouridine-54 N-methylase
MSRYYFAINAPPFSLSKLNLYTMNKNVNQVNPYIKAISDAFFLSNDFRKNLCLYFCTSFEDKNLIVKFDGSILRYLGPSSFSAAHLLIRAMNHLSNPTSKKGKLTPGIEVREEGIDWILDNHYKNKWVQITKSNYQMEKNMEFSTLSPVLFFFNFNHLKSEKIIHKISWGPLDIDEQVILTNHHIESVN